MYHLCLQMIWAAADCQKHHLQGSQGIDSQAVPSQGVNGVALESPGDIANERIGSHACLVAWNRF